MMKMNVTNEKETLAYVIYMITGSYFKKVICEKAKLQEQKLFLYYQEEKREHQYFLEDQCIEYSENVLLTTLPEKIWEQEVEVHFRSSGDTRWICFEGKNFVLAISAVKKGKRKVEFQNKLIKKNVKKEIPQESP